MLHCNINVIDFWLSRPPSRGTIVADRQAVAILIIALGGVVAAPLPGRATDLPAGGSVFLRSQIAEPKDHTTVDDLRDWDRPRVRLQSLQIRPGHDER